VLRVETATDYRIDAGTGCRRYQESGPDSFSRACFSSLRRLRPPKQVSSMTMAMKQIMKRRKITPIILNNIMGHSPRAHDLHGLKITHNA
jgi:hypothetical protein